MNAVLMTGLALTLAPLFAAEPVPSDWFPVEAYRSPFCLVAETVQVGVGKDLAIVEGDYDFRYVRRYETMAMPDLIPFRFTVFVPKWADSLDDFAALTGAKLHLGSLDFAPQDFVLVTEASGTALPFEPEDARLVILIFNIPRGLLHQQCRLHFSYSQKHYHYAGKTVAAVLPLLPDFESLKNELLFSRSDFTIVFETVDAVRLHRLSANSSVERETPQRVSVHPVDRETVAVEVSATAGK